jgi:hypothetical protein
MFDGARAIQFLRLHAKEWNLDPQAVAAAGGSSGAGISLWIGFHDDLADSTAADPVQRQSTRMSAIGSVDGQASYDPWVIAKLIDEKILLPPANQIEMIHNPRFGLLLKEQMDKLRVECVFTTPKNYSSGEVRPFTAEMVDFFIKHFPTPDEGPRRVGCREPLCLYDRVWQAPQPQLLP